MLLIFVFVVDSLTDFDFALHLNRSHAFTSSSKGHQTDSPGQRRPFIGQDPVAGYTPSARGTIATDPGLPSLHKAPPPGGLEPQRPSEMVFDFSEFEKRGHLLKRSPDKGGSRFHRRRFVCVRVCACVCVCVGVYACVYVCVCACGISYSPFLFYYNAKRI